MKNNREKDLKNLFLFLLERNGIDKSLFPLNWVYESDNSRLEKIANLAEKMALNGQEICPKTSIESIAKKPLYSIFEAVKKEEINKSFSYSYKVPTKSILLNVNSLEETKSLFPQQTNGNSNFQIKEILKKDISNITSQNIKATIETYLSILAKHTTNVSSNTFFKDVSFYDHFKTVLAISICLYDLELDNVEDCTSPVLLIGGDISGIQSFIYDIASKKASQNLKGRSFYLQLLSDSILSQLLEKLDLLTANVIYGSGGSFYILAPHTKEIEEKINEFEKDISERLFKISQTRLALILGYVSIEKNALLGKDNENNAWNNLHKNELEPKKKRKFALQIKSDFNYFFEPSELGGDMIRDAITSEELTEDEEIEYVKKSNRSKDAKEKPLKYTTQKQIDLGRKLKDTDFIIIANQQIDFFDRKDENEFEILGKYYYLLSKENFENRTAKFKNYEKIDLRIIALNKLNFLDGKIKGENHIYTFDFYGGNDYPTINGYDSKTFSEMAGMKEEDREYEKEFKESTFKRYAVLRMDVDNLGSIFQKGFTDDKRTFARLSTLSRNLDYFFKGFLNVIWNQKEYKNDTQIIYSGGDDLFIVGRWNTVIDMAVEIRTHFKEWVCNNEYLGISAGVSIVTPKFPIAKAAEEAGEAEKEAKKHEKDKWSKNSITLMGIPLHWDNEYPFVKDIKTQIHDMYNDIRSTLTKLQGFYEQIENENKKMERKKNYIPSKSWRWQLAYQLARTAERNKNLKEILGKMKIGIFTSRDSNGKTDHAKHNYFKLLNLAIRLAELEHRNNS